jgi:hypothetical protein
MGKVHMNSGPQVKVFCYASSPSNRDQVFFVALVYPRVVSGRDLYYTPARKLYGEYRW